MARVVFNKTEWESPVKRYPTSTVDYFILHDNVRNLYYLVRMLEPEEWEDDYEGRLIVLDDSCYLLIGESSDLTQLETRVLSYQKCINDTVGMIHEK